MADLTREQIEVIEQFLADFAGARSMTMHPHFLPRAKAMVMALASLSEAAPAERTFPVLPDGLHPATKQLVFNFAMALADKLHAAEQKYGYSDGWRNTDWMDECRAQLMEHVRKGDPRDVAAYCAFLWHHRESTAAPASQPAPSDEKQMLGNLLAVIHEDGWHYQDEHGTQKAVEDAIAKVYRLKVQPAPSDEAVRLLEQSLAWLEVACTSGTESHYPNGAQTPNGFAIATLCNQIRALLSTPPASEAAQGERE